MIETAANEGAHVEEWHMTDGNALKLRLRGDRDIVLTRSFDAPRALVFQAWTDPKYLPRWWGQGGSTLAICEVDLRPGGEWRFVERSRDGKQFPFHGVYREIAPPERLVYTFVLEAEEWRERLVEVTTSFEESQGKTKVTQMLVHKTTADRDAYIKSGMERGAGESYARLDELLASQPGATGARVQRGSAGTQENAR